MGKNGFQQCSLKVDGEITCHHAVVPCLSPVRTQILRPARPKLAIASGTPSCSLSSMAVAPTRDIPTSISSYTSDNRSSRFSRATLQQTSLVAYYQAVTLALSLSASAVSHWSSCGTPDSDIVWCAYHNSHLGHRL